MLKGKKIVLGVTGGIASGKSEVCRILAKNGFLWIDADQETHTVLRDERVVQKIVAEFGSDILCTGAGEDKIDRKKLGKVVFTDTKALRTLEEIVHPAVLNAIYHRVNDEKGSVVIEAIKLFSSGVWKVCDFVWLVTASEEVRINRLIEKRGLTREDAVQRITAQKQNDWEPEKIDEVFFSDGSLAELSQRVNFLLRQI